MCSSLLNIPSRSVPICGRISVIKGVQNTTDVGLWRTLLDFDIVLANDYSIVEVCCFREKVAFRFNKQITNR